jgi:hypothetical protein
MAGEELRSIERPVDGRRILSKYNKKKSIYPNIGFVKYTFLDKKRARACICKKKVVLLQRKSEMFNL